MTQSNDQPNDRPDDRDRQIDRQFRGFVGRRPAFGNRRLTRLEETQVTGKELNRGFDRVYDEIDALEDQINARFDRLESEVRELRAETNGKLDAILRRLTGMERDT